MPAIALEGVTHRYGSKTSLDNVDLSVLEGTVFALLGPNGAGKTTLLQIAMGLREPTRCKHVRIFDKDVHRLTADEKSRIGYVAEGLRLPDWMTLKQAEAFVAPLHSTWDYELADELRERFELTPDMRVKKLSRGESMKAVLLCVLASRPKLLIMDEPLTGLDVITKDEIVRGTLETASTEGWTVFISSHDIAEVEMLADHVAFLKSGRIILSEPTESLLERYHGASLREIFISVAGKDSSLREEAAV
jgi:ABC-2 type transport system ATP-binding protein